MQVIPRKDETVSVLGSGYINLTMNFKDPMLKGFKPDILSAWRTTGGIVFTPYWGTKWMVEDDHLSIRKSLIYAVAVGIRLNDDAKECMGNLSQLQSVAGLEETKKIIRIVFQPLFDRTVMVDQPNEISFGKSAIMKPVREYWKGLDQAVRKKQKDYTKAPMLVEDMPDFFGSF